MIGPVTVDMREFLIRLVRAGDTAVARPRAAKGYAQGRVSEVCQAPSSDSDGGMSLFYINLL